LFVINYQLKSEYVSIRTLLAHLNEDENVSLFQLLINCNPYFMFQKQVDYLFLRKNKKLRSDWNR